MPNLEAIGDSSLVLRPELIMVQDDGGELHEYTQEPTDPVRRLPEEGDPFYWHWKASAECRHGGPGSTVNFWKQFAYATRLSLGVRMHSTAAFFSTPNAQGHITGGETTRGFNDGSERGYPLWFVLSTGQVSDVVRFDEQIL